VIHNEDPEVDPPMTWARGTTVRSAHPTLSGQNASKKELRYSSALFLWDKPGSENG
jgi:hypothetical protein